MRFRRWLAALAPRLIRAALFGVPLVALSVFFAWEVPRISSITAAQTDALPIFLGLRAWWPETTPMPSRWARRPISKR